MKQLALLLVWLSVMHSAGLSAAQPLVSASEKVIVTETLERLGKQAGRKIPVDTIQATPVKGVLEVTSDLNIFYVTNDGRYLILGEIVDTSRDQKDWSLTEQAARKLRVQALEAINLQDMIIFPAKGNKIATVTVFTDLDCSYCRKLQENIQDYTDAGLEIRYLAFPRSGPNTPSFEKAISVWCSKDKPRDYALAIEGKDIPKDQCANNPVAMEFELGKQMGISGTPTMILDNGTKLGGLVDAKTILKILKGE